MKTETPQKPRKKKGPIRTEVVVPFFIVALLTWAYFHFLFDHHLRKGIEYVGYEVIGAEVDIANLETSFLKGTIRLQGLEITNSQKPERDMLAIGDIRFGVAWDGLLRARLVVDEMAVEQIQIDVPRKSPGRIKPPEPKKEEDSGALGKAANEVKEKALSQTEKKNKDNVLGDLAAVLGGGSDQAQLSKIEGTLESKKKLTELQKLYDDKSKVWDQKLKDLPQQKEIQALGERLNKIKTSNFKNPQELIDSLNQLKSVLSDADQKYKTIQQTSQDLGGDLKTFDQGLKDLDGLVKKDIATLENRFHIPKLDAKSLAEGVFRSYLNPYLARMEEYRGMAQKYMPPNLLKKGKEEPDPSMQPRPRAKGVTYEFGKLHAYPLFWIKRISVSSKANASLGTGDMAGKVTDVASNQILVGRPTVATFTGDFPSMNLMGFAFKGIFDNLKAQSKVSYEASIRQYPIQGRPLVDSDDVHVLFEKADAAFQSQGELVGFRDLQFTLQNSLKQVDYNIKAANSTVEEILKNVFTSLPAITLDVKGQGHLPGLDLAINSNLGPELQRGFENAIKKKVDEAKAKIQNYVNEQIGQNKAKLEGDYGKLKSQVDGEVKKLQAQIDNQKKQAEGKMDSAQKDGQNKAQKQLQEQGQKAVDDLKKQFGL